jgi:hypothetical protein
MTIVIDSRRWNGFVYHLLLVVAAIVTALRVVRIPAGTGEVRE